MPEGNELAPEAADFLLLMGWAARELGRHEDAVEYLSQALDLHTGAGPCGKKTVVAWAAHAGRATSHFALATRTWHFRTWQRHPAATRLKNGHFMTGTT